MSLPAPVRRLLIRTLEARGGIEPPMRVLQTLALPLGHRTPWYSVLAGALPYLSTQDDGLGNLFQRSLFLLALALQSQEGFALAES